jgi:hypothetical protein
MTSFRRQLPRLAEQASWTLGLVGLVLWGTFHLVVARSSQHDLDRFAALQRAARDTPDQALWSPQRIAAWQKTADEPFPAPLAILRIPKIRLEVAVLPGTDIARSIAAPATLKTRRTRARRAIPASPDTATDSSAG